MRLLLDALLTGECKLDLQSYAVFTHVRNWPEMLGPADKDSVQCSKRNAFQATLCPPTCSWLQANADEEGGRKRKPQAQLTRSSVNITSLQNMVCLHSCEIETRAITVHPRAHMHLASGVAETGSNETILWWLRLYFWDVLPPSFLTVP